MTEHRVVVLGEARVDEIRDPAGVRESVTGDAVEVATALQGHGLGLTVVAPVAEDADGDRIRTALHDRGIRLVAVPAPQGTLRHSVVRDRGGSETERRRGEGEFTDTRRSLAAQAEADLIVDLRDRELGTIAEVRDGVLRALGLDAATAPTDTVLREGDAIEAPAESGRPPQHATPAPEAEPGAEAAAAEAGPEPAPRTEAETAAGPARVVGMRAPVLLPAPVVAGTYRHTPVRLLPEAPATHAPAPDWYGLEVRLARIAT